MERNYFRMTLSILFPILVIGIVFFNSSPDNFRIFMNGELSIKHSYVEDGCKTCHVPWSGVNNESCLECHYDAEYEVEEDWAEIHGHPSKKIKCFDCHREHQGRAHNLNVVESTNQ